MRVDNKGCPNGCNSLGMILFKGKFIPCPIHGKKDSLLIDGKLPNGEVLFDILQIPVEYREHWVTDISRLFMNEDISKNCCLDSIIQLKYILETLYNTVAVDNNIYCNSLYVYANPNLIDLKPFIYTLQRIAFEQNLSVLPATSVNDLAGLLALQSYDTIRVNSESDVDYITSLNRLAGEGADWCYRTKLTYTDYLKCSLCVILDNNSVLENNLKMLQGFIEDRARRNLPTYVFSTSFFDVRRENLFFDKLGNRKLSSLTPYLLLGKNQEIIAREHGWLRNKNVELNGVIGSNVKGYSLSTFQTNSANTFDLD